MKYARFLIPLVLLSIAVPAFAACGYCDPYGNCQYERGLYQRCRYEFPNNCTVLCVEQATTNCGPASAEAVNMPSFNSGYRILSVTVEEAKAATATEKSGAVPPKKLKKTT